MKHSDFVVFLDQIPPEGLVCELETSDAELDGFHLAVPQKGALKVRLALSTHGARVRARGEVAVTVGLECARCLRGFTRVVESEVDAFMQEVRDSDYEENRQLTAEEVGVQPLEKGTLDLRETVVEQVHLCLPVKPLCDDGCKGICPRCGGDLNETTCSCDGGGGDPRWDALKQLRMK